MIRKAKTIRHFDVNIKQYNTQFYPTHLKQKIKLPKKSVMHTLELDFNGLVEKLESMLKKATLVANSVP